MTNQNGDREEDTNPAGTLSRRRILASLTVGVPAGLLLARCAPRGLVAIDGAADSTVDTSTDDHSAEDSSHTADATPSCEETEDDIEGPFYLQGAPLSNVFPTAAGVPLVLSGVVRSLTNCEPVAAELDFWQANAAGEYDRQGFTFRGRIQTGADGAYRLTTIVPGRYLNGAQYRPAHIHVKVRIPGHRELTTQLYFEGDPFNSIDPWFDARLLVRNQGANEGLFDFSIRRT